MARARARERAGDISPTSPSRGRYWPALDGLRAVAIVTVMLYRLELRGTNGFFLGLTVFFVLSGFLITGLLLAEWADTGRIAFRDFYARRALRLFPALFTLLAVLGAARLLAGPDSPFPAASELAAAAFYVANVAAAFGWLAFDLVGHTWSLATEEQFYLLWPVVLVALLRRRAHPAAIVAVAIAVAAGSDLVRTVVYDTDPAAEADAFARATFAPDTRAGELMIGCAAAVVAHYRLLPATRLARVALRAVAVVSVAVLAFFAQIAGHNMATFAVVLTVAPVLVAVQILDMRVGPGTWRERALSLTPVVWVGRLSYGLYLWHFPVFRLVEEYGDGADVVVFGEKLALTAAAAMASFFAVERPFLRLKARYSPPPAATAGG